MEGLDLLPADKNLVGVNLELIGVDRPGIDLSQTPPENQARTTQYILIDCPPALDLLTLNALMAADAVLVPIQCEFFALEGVSELMDTIDRVRDSFGHPCKIEGILLDHVRRPNQSHQAGCGRSAGILRKRCLSNDHSAQYPLAEAPSHGKPILLYDPASRGSEAYIQLAKEILTQ